MKILVIDDEKPTLSMFRLFLTAYGYEVHTAEDGEKGLALFHEIKPGIVFTDIKMPGLDGLEVLRRIRKSGIPSEVIVITGHGDMENAVEALDLDASDFINKPVERHALSSALARAEKRRQMQKDLVFEFFETEKENHHIVSLQGKLSASARPLFSSLFKTLKSGNEKEVILIFNDGFSIDKSGISLLMEVIQKLKQKNISIVMENLSYNYLRIFQMAGMDKFATMKEALAED
ncbi:MAG: anti-anti-sigma factor [Desulfobacterales bacterium RIFOXYA12_FULL_46_15]|nr:MAG: anti-anti-sigma factor [Desulfobacula sp. GWF2_41_7]OGR22243.1 MAG: anti-anti-sigma factor [Desulfobacterales bacterium RIFOXYA12_FULL_46_15]